MRLVEVTESKPDGDTSFLAWFHCWAGTSERAYAVVEREANGEVVHCSYLDRIQFLDSRESPNPKRYVQS